jgi:hypothetical protein
MHQMGWFEHPKDVAEDFLQWPKHPGRSKIAALACRRSFFAGRNFAIAA